MSKTLSLLLAGAAFTALAGAAVAQPYRAPDRDRDAPKATLYDQTNFRGRSVVIEGENGNLANVFFNDRARSAKFEGSWRVCEDADYDSRCETVSGSVANLDGVGMTGRISSLRADGYDDEPDDGGWAGGPGGPGGWVGGGQQARDTAVLYELPGFRGRSVTVTRENADLNGIGFNDRTGSARFEGTWKLCADSWYRGRCETFTGAVSNLEGSALGRGTSSLQIVGGGPGGYPGPGGGYPGPGGGYPGPGGGGSAQTGVEGRGVVFYARPRMNTGDLWGTGKQAADDFCRRQGHAYSVYFDISERSARSQDFTGRWYDNGTVLRDVLCKK